MKGKIPNRVFITKGSGSFEFAVHAGSYHMALFDAGISEYNILTYSSVLPANTEFINRDDLDDNDLVFGQELYTIMAVAHGMDNEHISAGIIYAALYEDENFDTKHGYLVCELAGNYRAEELEQRLYKIIENLFKDTFDKTGLFLGEPVAILESYTVQARYGTALVAICVADFLN
jgi:arginine decarboxylase